MTTMTAALPTTPAAAQTVRQPLAFRRKALLRRPTHDLLVLLGLAALVAGGLALAAAARSLPVPAGDGFHDLLRALSQP